MRTSWKWYLALTFSKCILATLDHGKRYWIENEDDSFERNKKLHILSLALYFKRSYVTFSHKPISFFCFLVILVYIVFMSIFLITTTNEGCRNCSQGYFTFRERWLGFKPQDTNGSQELRLLGSIEFNLTAQWHPWKWSSRNLLHHVTQIAIDN